MGSQAKIRLAHAHDRLSKALSAIGLPVHQAGRWPVEVAAALSRLWSYQDLLLRRLDCWPGSRFYDQDLRAALEAGRQQIESAVDRITQRATCEEASPILEALEELADEVRCCCRVIISGGTG